MLGTVTFEYDCETRPRARLIGFLWLQVPIPTCRWGQKPLAGSRVEPSVT
jgi:hypothetical protein